MMEIADNPNPVPIYLDESSEAPEGEVEDPEEDEEDSDFLLK